MRGELGERLSRTARVGRLEHRGLAEFLLQGVEDTPRRLCRFGLGGLFKEAQFSGFLGNLFSGLVATLLEGFVDAVLVCSREVRIAHRSLLSR